MTNPRILQSAGTHASLSGISGNGSLHLVSLCQGLTCQTDLPDAGSYRGRIRGVSDITLPIVLEARCLSGQLVAYLTRSSLLPDTGWVPSFALSITNLKWLLRVCLRWSKLGVNIHMAIYPELSHDNVGG